MILQLETPGRMVSQSEIGRLANVPAPRVAAAVRNGTISPDAIVCGRIKLFSVERLDELKAALESVSKNVPNISL